MRRRPFLGLRARLASSKAGENAGPQSLDRSGHPERGADLVQHPPLPGAHPLDAKAQEATLLAGVGGRLGRDHQPAVEGSTSSGVVLAVPSSFTARSSTSTW